MSLTAVLLMILMFFYRESMEMNRLNDEAAIQSFQERYVDNRLASVLSNLIPATDNEREFFFKTTPDFAEAGIAVGDALVFGYDNSMRWDRNFASDVNGTLYLDKYKRLCLVTTPLLKHWEDESTLPIHKEILLEHVEELSFLFRFPADTMKVENQQKLDLKEEKYWTPGKKLLPAVMFISVQLESKKKGEVGEKRNFGFVFPNRDHPIEYNI